MSFTFCWNENIWLGAIYINRFALCVFAESRDILRFCDALCRLALLSPVAVTPSGVQQWFILGFFSIWVSIAALSSVNW